MSFAVGVLIALTVVALLVWVGRRRQRLVQTAALGLVGAVAIWSVGLLLIRSGWKDIDGFIDCHGYCHGWHYFGAFLFGTPPLVVLLLLLVLLVRGLRAVSSR